MPILNKIYISLFGIVLLIFGCASNPSLERSSPGESPVAAKLVTMDNYSGYWEMDQCKDGDKQAQRVTIQVHDGHLYLERWQWKDDPKPLFTARIQPQSPTLVTYQSKDMRDDNPVVNRTHWTWVDRRIVGSFQWVPGPGDLRGNWMAVAMAQYYIDANQPNQLVWTRWGTTHSKHGKQDWYSECSYRRYFPMVNDQPGSQEFDKNIKKAEHLHTISMSSRIKN